MAREYTEYEREAYGIPETVDTPPVDDAPIVADDIVPPAVDDVVVPPIDDAPPVVPAVVLAEPAPIVADSPYKSKKFIEVDDEAELYAKLNAKYGHSAMSADEKAIALLRKQNPELEDKDIAFIAESEYGIGAEEIPDDELDDAQRRELQKQAIARKRLTKQADTYFAEQATAVALDGIDPTSLDPDYQAYKGQVQAQQAEQTAREAHVADVHTQIDTNSKVISEITESVEIELDDNKLVVPVKFKLNDEKQRELADFAKRYTPTQAEYDAFNNPDTGKFDYKGYMESLAPIAFAKDIAKAGMRQALAQDRQQFIEKELKNSTLRNNDVSQVVNKPFDIIDHWQFGN